MRRILKKNTILFLFLAGIILLVVSGIIFYLQFQTMLKANNNNYQSYQTIRAANTSLLAIDDATIKVDMFLHSGDVDNIKNLPETIIAAQVNLTTLDQLTRDDDKQKMYFKQLAPLAEKKLANLRQITADYLAGDKQGALKAASDPDRIILTANISQLVFAIKHIEIMQLNASDIQYRITLRNCMLIFLSAGIICTLIFIFTYVSLRKYLH